MSTDPIALATAAMLGCLHALEVDHMVAVTTFVSRRPTAAAVRFGLRWGLGHSLAVLAAGGLLLATGLRWPARLDASGEALVGLMLFALGGWALASARKLHLHSSQEHGGHAHLHLHAGGPRVGLGLGYLACFGIGVTVAMSLFALLAAGAMRRANARSLAWGRRVVRLAGGCAMLVGIWWVAGAAGL